MGECVTLTRAMLHAAGKESGAGRSFNKTQLAALGVQWPPRKGWLTALVGQRVPREAYERFMALKGSSQPAQQ